MTTATSFDIAAIEARHYAVRSGTTCDWDAEPWPCDTEVMRREAAKGRVDKVIAGEWREDADRLYKALRTMYGIHHKALAPYDRCRDKADRALAAHEALTGEKP